MKRLLIVLLAMCIAVPSFAGRHHKGKRGHHKRHAVAHHHHRGHGHKRHHRHVAVAGHIEQPKQLTVNDILSRMFEAQKGCFALPVRGEIAGNELRTLGNPKLVMPPAIDIQCRPGEKVRAVHEGVVSSVFSMDNNESYVVIIQHGYYFTVYNSLESTQVKKGDAVNANQSIGVVGCNDDGQPMLNFQIWKATTGKTATNKLVSPGDWFVRM